MTILSVAAPGNGSGKTLTLAAILGAFPDALAAVKFTTVYKDGVNCPRTERSCACRALHGRFTVVTDPRVLAQEETDTARLKQAGARSVFWCLARPGAHREAWEHLRDALLAAERAIITEGNSIVPVLQPDLLVMVASPGVPRARWKADSWDLLRRADHVIVNRHGAPDEAVRALAEETARARSGRPPVIEDVSRPLEAWTDAALRSDVARALSGSASRREPAS